MMVFYWNVFREGAGGTLQRHGGGALRTAVWLSTWAGFTCEQQLCIAGGFGCCDNY